MNKSSSIQVIDRCTALMDAIAGYDGSVSLKLLSADTGLHPSTAFRILAALMHNGFVKRDSSGGYLLGRKLVQLANRVRHGVDIREEAHEIMTTLRDKLGETINLTVREGDEVIYIERASPKRMMKVEQVIGSRAPLHVTAVGKLMLGELGDSHVKAYASRTGLPAYTDHTLVTVQDLLDEVLHARDNGFAFDNQEAEEGVGCIGAPVYDGSGELIAGLSVSAPIERRRDEWVGLLRDAARRLSQRLGYRGDAYDS